MKHLHSFCSLLVLTATIGFVSLLAGCQQDPSSTGVSQPALPLKSSPPATYPALAWVGAKIVNGVTYSSIFVADSALGHEAWGQVASSSWTYVHYHGEPTWSPSGASICFAQIGSSTLPDTIKAFDVSVDNKENIVGSNLRTVFGFANQSARLNNAFWSSTTSMGKIAYTTGEGATNSLYVVSQSGGTPTKICSVDTGWASYGSPLSSTTWSPDDSRLAVIRIGSSGSSSTIMIFNTSTWAYVDSITVSGSIFGLEWSRSGSMNKLAFGLEASGSIHKYLYYCDPTTGATPTTSGIEGGYPSWSPNNSSVLYENAYTEELTKNKPLTSSTTAVSYFTGLCMKWRR